jgi:alpha-tubulin suppressor-like RCC1 family protein
MNALLILANSNVDYMVKDKEGMTFLEMFEASIKLAKIPITLRNVVKLEDVDSSFVSDDEVVVIEHALSDFETPSASNSIWTWGSNNNYLLGSGLADSRSVPEQLNLTSKQTANIDFTELLELDPQIIMIASSKYHVAILSKSNLYIYGFGVNGRLGLGDEKTQLQPKIVKGIDGCVSFVALGTDHSLAITDDGKVWSWGSNEFSQLGIADQCSKSLLPQEVVLKKIRAVGATASKCHSAIYTESGTIYTWGTNNGQLGYVRAVQNYPKKITSLSTQTILRIASTNNSTAVLVESKHVIIFCKYQKITLSFPVLIAPAIMRSRSFKQPFPVSIKAGDNDIGVVLSSGDVCVWNSYSNETKLGSKTKRVWLATRKNRMAIDCAFGVDSQVLIVTATGHVFLGCKRAETHERDSRSYKFSQTPNLEHIRSVVASSGGSFAAIRSDFRFPQLIDDSPTFATDIKIILQGARIDYDCCFIVENEETIFAHRIILANRSNWLSNLFDGDSTALIADAESIPCLRLPKISARAMKLMLEFLYTGIITKPCENFSYFAIATKDSDPGMIRLHEDLKMLVKHFQLDETEVLQSTLSHALPKHYFMDMDVGKSFTNVIVDLKDGFIKSHVVLLSTRCEFFSALIGKKSNWVLAERDGTPVIKLSHIPKEIFQVLLRWIVTDSVDLFVEIQKDSLFEWMEFIKETQIFADELLLFRVSDICSALLARFLTIRNVLDLLQHSMLYNSLLLKEACLDFIVRNMETFLRRGALQSTPSDVLLIIEEKVKQLQREKLPLMLGDGGYYSKLLEDAALRKLEGKESKLSRISSFESVHSVIYETLSPSLLPSPSMRPCSSGSASTQFTISPLLMPINVFPSRSNGIATSMEDFHLGSSWTESKSRYGFLLIKEKKFFTAFNTSIKAPTTLPIFTHLLWPKFRQ